jgi:transcriptional regulator with XRE-family HTH domain
MITLSPEYLARLNRIVDQVFRAADTQDLPTAELVRRSGLGRATVDRLDHRVTRVPQLRTVFHLARAVGMDVTLSSPKNGNGRRKGGA